jgi:hypothetical protein
MACHPTAKEVAKALGKKWGDTKLCDVIAARPRLAQLLPRGVKPGKPPVPPPTEKVPLRASRSVFDEIDEDQETWGWIFPNSDPAARRNQRDDAALDAGDRVLRKRLERALALLRKLQATDAAKNAALDYIGPRIAALEALRSLWPVAFSVIRYPLGKPDKRSTRNKRPQDWHVPLLVVALEVCDAIKASGGQPPSPRSEALGRIASELLATKGYDVDPGTARQFLRRWVERYGWGYEPD